MEWEEGGGRGRISSTETTRLIRDGERVEGIWRGGRGRISSTETIRLIRDGEKRGEGI